MTPLVVGAALLLMAADSAPAGAQSTIVAPVSVKGATQAAKPRSDDDPDRVICRNEAITGSRFVKRVCMVRADWDEQERRTQELERNLGDQPSAHPSGGYGGGH